MLSLDEDDTLVYIAMKLSQIQGALKVAAAGTTSAV
jgi:hypothetical protein